MPKVLFLTQSGDTLPSVRFRVLQYLRDAQARGISAERRTIPKTAAGRIPFYASLPRVEVIVLQKRLLSVLELSLLRMKCRRLAFDFDDALWATHPNSAGSPGCAARESKALERLMATCARVDLVIAGNTFLADKVGGVNNNVLVLPTPLDCEKYSPGDQHGEAGVDQLPLVGWMGTSCNLFFLPEVFEAMAQLSGKTRFQVIADEPFESPPGMDVGFSYWSSEQEVEQLRAMDVGLMPLTDDEYTRGKCGFKLLQYMACGAVPVASGVGFNTEIIEHGKDGFLAADAGDFLKYTARLVENADLRRKMAAAARSKVEARFDVKASAERLWRSLGL